MMKLFDKLIAELKKLNFPNDSFAIYGSGVLAALGIRDCRDIDIIVKQTFWTALLNKFKDNFNGKSIELGNISIWNNYLPLKDKTDSLIERAIVINNIRYVKIEDLLRWKKAMKRDKDIVDIRLIKKYLSNNE